MCFCFFFLLRTPKGCYLCGLNLSIIPVLGKKQELIYEFPVYSRQKSSVRRVSVFLISASLSSVRWHLYSPVCFSIPCVMIPQVRRSLETPTVNSRVCAKGRQHPSVSRKMTWHLGGLWAPRELLPYPQRDSLTQDPEVTPASAMASPSLLCTSVCKSDHAGMPGPGLQFPKTASLPSVHPAPSSLFWVRPSLSNSCRAQTLVSYSWDLSIEQPASV